MASIRIATRGSALARWQADHVAALLAAAARDGVVSGEVTTELVIVSTQGDRDTTSPLHSIGGKGVFCKEVQSAVLDRRADIAVHSAKDLPAITPEGLVLAAVPERANPHDALVGAGLEALGPGAVIGTGSVRRRAQLKALRPDLTFAELRGNIETRLAKLDDGGFDAIVMAAAAVDRLGIERGDVHELSADSMIPQVGQGALAIEARAGDDPDDVELRRLLRTIEHGPSARRFGAERAFLAELGGDCDLPAGAHARIAGDTITLAGFLAAEDLSPAVSLAASSSLDGDVEALGRKLAGRLVAELGAASER